MRAKRRGNTTTRNTTPDATTTAQHRNAWRNNGAANRQRPPAMRGREPTTAAGNARPVNYIFAERLGPFWPPSR
jgi:hypothetical protein